MGRTGMESRSLRGAVAYNRRRGRASYPVPGAEVMTEASPSRVRIAPIARGPIAVGLVAVGGIAIGVVAVGGGAAGIFAVGALVLGFKKVGAVSLLGALAAATGFRAARR